MTQRVYHLFRLFLFWFYFFQFFLYLAYFLAVLWIDLFYKSFKIVLIVEMVNSFGSWGSSYSRLPERLVTFRRLLLLQKISWLECLRKSWLRDYSRLENIVWEMRHVLSQVKIFWSVLSSKRSFSRSGTRLDRSFLNGIFTNSFLSFPSQVHSEILRFVLKNDLRVSLLSYLEIRRL